MGIFYNALDTETKVTTELPSFKTPTNTKWPRKLEIGAALSAQDTFFTVAFILLQ